MSAAENTLFSRHWITGTGKNTQIYRFNEVRKLKTIKERILKIKFKNYTFHRPYHGMLLLQDVQDLLDEIPADASPDLARLVKVTSPLKSFQTLSSDTDLPITLVYCINNKFPSVFLLTVRYNIIRGFSIDRPFSLLGQSDDNLSIVRN